MSAIRFVCFGELLLRLSAPGRERLLQSPRLDVQYGGAEANVAVALACFGHDAAMVSTVPGNALGAAAAGELRRHGVDAGGVRTGPGRMGLYFLETGAVHRPSQVLYDRAASAFALAPPESYGWPELLDGAQVLHVSGVTPAVGANAAAAALAAMRAARELGLHVSFDGNYRSKLWRSWNENPQSILHDIFACTDTLFADHRDVAIALGRQFNAATPSAALAAAAEAAFEAFPVLERIVATERSQHSVDHHDLSAAMITRGRTLNSPVQQIGSIVDRIGAGDAFAAGVLHGLFAGMSEQESLDFGLAAGCLKHSMPGDFLRMSVHEVNEFLGERRFDVRR
jgi:2-dehydro-3-deoxygluconokinase